MPPLGLVDSENGVSPILAAAGTALRLHVEDALASSRRLWVRGRLVGQEVPKRKDSEGHWWQRWWPRTDSSLPAPQVTLETQVSGCLLKAQVPLQEDGRFEALFAVDLPDSRRGWRLARNRVVIGEHAAEGCGIVIQPPAGATRAAVVLLPLSCTMGKNGPQNLARLNSASRLGPVLERLEQPSKAKVPVYYLAGVEGTEASREAELALAATALGWPGGSFVLVSAIDGSPAEGVIQGLDRLRWLFAGSLELLAINLEPALAAPLTVQAQVSDDRAPLRHLVQPGEKIGILVGNDGPLAPLIPARPRRPRLARVTRYPLVFCHGMLAFSTLRMQLPEETNYFTPLREFLSQRGFRVLYPQVAPTSGVVARAQQLREQIQCWTREPVNIIAHSFGGLDARHLITHLDMADQVRSLTTVSTPHRGTYVADWFVANFRQRVPLLLGMEALGMNVDGFRDCGLAACRSFNAVTPDMPQVRYFSYGGEVAGSDLSPMLRRSWNILTPVEGPNDGLVSVASAHWGEYLGTLHADHFAQTPDALYLHPGKDFDALGFFSHLVEDLARRGL